ncbi:site-specific integrase [uncultured Microbacterium sp.]|uniref:tyrosine-type recombinase/integrase n=1 Tax=uncultured Microbacterium sp. TaxID=191216 RepID=UPI0025D6FB59|nr:site-specific integrase [uncultured Microbacterium sp.]
MAGAKKRKRRESFGAIRQRSSGRYQASYVGPDGVRHYAPQTFDNMTDARGWLAIQQANIHSKSWSSTDTRAIEQARRGRTETLADYAESWISTRTNRHGEHLRPRTAAEYRRLVKGPLRSFADLRLAAITSEGVRVWYSGLIIAGTKTQAARAYELLKSIMATAVNDGRIKSNPCQIRGAASASTGKKTTPPTAAELQKMVDAMPQRYKAAVVLAAWTGVRFGELMELRRKDIEVLTEGDQTTIVVNVSRGVTQVTGQGFVVGPTKSEAGVRSIVLPPHVNAVVLGHLKDHVPRFPESLLFPAADGSTHLSQSTFYRHWDTARSAAKRPDLPWHGLRHYGATRAAVAGATLKELQARLGHSTVAAAMRYQHTAGRDEELARRMSELA